LEGVCDIGRGLHSGRESRSLGELELREWRLLLALRLVLRGKPGILRLQILLLLKLLLRLLWLLSREASELRLELSRWESGGLRLKLRVTEWRRLAGKSSWLGRESGGLRLLHWRQLLALGELHRLLLLLRHEWCLAWAATSTTAEEGIRRREHY
jgi:hypothetical protein